MHSKIKWATRCTYIADLFTYIRAVAAPAAYAPLLKGTAFFGLWLVFTALSLSQSDALLLGRSDNARLLFPYAASHNPSLALAVRTQGVYAVTELQSLPVVLPFIVDALQANDLPTRNAATRAISNVVLKLDRNTYKRIPIQNWNSIELQLERASLALSLQPQHVELQKDIDRLLRRVNSGEWNRQWNLRTRKPLAPKQLELLASLAGSSSEGAPRRIQQFENEIVSFSKEQKQELLEHLCQQVHPSLLEIIILSSDRHDDDFIESLLWLAEGDKNTTWEVLIASCSPQKKETRKLLTEAIFRHADRPSLRSELLHTLSRSHTMEPEFSRRLLRDFSTYLDQPRDSDAHAFVNAMSTFLVRHKGSLPSPQLDELKQLSIKNVLQHKLDSSWRSSLIGFLVDSFPNDPFVADTLVHLLGESNADPSIQFDTLAAISTAPNICQKAKLRLLHIATLGDVPSQELAIQGLALVPELSITDIEKLITIAFDDLDVADKKPQETTRVLAAKAIAAQGPSSIELLRSLLSQRMRRKADSEDLERLLRTIELSGQRDQGIDAMLSQIVRDPFRSLEMRIAAWNARATTAILTDRVINEIHYYLNDMEYEPEARATALSSLARICGACSTPKLSMYSHDPDPLIRIAARFAHHYAGESALAARLLIEEIESVSNNESLSEEEKSQTITTVRDLILDIGESADESLFVVLNSDTYSPAQKSIAFRTLASGSNRSWKKLLSFVNEANLENQFSREIRAAWNFDPDLVPALYAKILTANPATTYAQELWQIAEDTTLGLGAGEDGEFWGDNAMRVAISEHAQQLRTAPPANATTAQPTITSMEARDESNITAAQAPKIAESATTAAPETEPNVTSDGPAQSYMSKPTRLMALNQNTLLSEKESVALSANTRLVNVFYGTNRQLRALPNLGGTLRWGAFTLSLVCFLVCVVKFAKQRSMRFAIIALLGLMGLTSMARDSLDIAYWLPNRNAMFTGEYSSEIKYGVCQVSIPPIHAPGELESPSLLLKWEVVQDPEKHIVLKSTQPLDRSEFFSSLQQTLDSKGKSLLVFIHGYNVSFDDAARRTAQMSYDLKFPGAAVFYSWPSYNNWYRYPDDKANIERSVDQIKEFLQQLAIDSKAESINLIAHSMGNVGLTQAIAKMGVDRPIFNQVVLAAPDIDAQVFRNDIAPRITNKAQRVTLYTSKNDLALVASRFFNASGRLGDSRHGPIAVPGIDTIDATDVDTSLLGHSYYGSNASVLDDIASLLLGKPLSERSHLKARSDATPPYWTFDPAWRTAKNANTNSEPMSR
jgi:esterase/lipase superfamily enzyme